MSEIFPSIPLPPGMRPDVAQRRIEAFRKHFREFGDAHLYLAYHAAFPLALTPDLLYRLRANFPRDIYNEELNIPWIAVADLLLSSLCNEVGYELYEMNVAVRTELLSQLKANPKFGSQRLNDLSNFLRKYVQQQLDSPDPAIRKFAQAQEWTAIAATRPEEAAHNIALTLSKLDPSDKAEFARMASLIETFIDTQDEFTQLLEYARGMEYYARGDASGAAVQFNQSATDEEFLQIEGIKLFIPKQIHEKIENTKEQLQKVFENAPPIADVPVESHHRLTDIPRTKSRREKRINANEIMENSRREDIPSYKIIVLGASGSGKTVLLASMYHELSIQRPDTGFFIETGEPEQRKRLNYIYNQVAGSGDWPLATHYTHVSEWHFTCRVQPTGDSIYSALRFTYLDYAGERMTDPQGDTGLDLLDEEFEKADALLGILDGQKLLALMQRQPEGAHFVYSDLPNILQIMQRNENPIHFVITKWDLLEGKYSLRDVRNRLLEIDVFRYLVENRIKKYIVRLIPVSSVGVGFAQLQPDGSMQKRPGAYPRPFQVEVPLSCVLPDKFITEMSRLAEQQKMLRGGPLTASRPQPTIWDNIGLYLGGLIRGLRGFLLGRYQFEDVTLQSLIHFAEVSSRAGKEEGVQELEKLRAEREISLKKVQNEQTATRHAVNSFLYLEQKLAIDFPESDLSRIR